MLPGLTVLSTGLSDAPSHFRHRVATAASGGAAGGSASPLSARTGGGAAAACGATTSATEGDAKQARGIHAPSVRPPAAVTSFALNNDAAAEPLPTAHSTTTRRSSEEDAEMTTLPLDGDRVTEEEQEQEECEGDGSRRKLPRLFDAKETELTTRAVAGGGAGRTVLALPPLRTPVEWRAPSDVLAMRDGAFDARGVAMA